jgi:transposase
LRGGHLLGAAERRPLERLTQTFSFFYNLLAAAQGMVRGGPLARSLGAIAPQARPGGQNPTRRSLRRRDVLLGKKRGEYVGKTKRGKGTKIMVLVDAAGLPLGVTIASASPHEVTLIEPLLEDRLLRRRIRRLIYDAAADSDPLRARLLRRGIDLICPHRSNRVKPPTQDGRKLRRYRRRYKVERSISWLQNFRRLVTRYEHKAQLFLGFVQLACLTIVLRRF